MDMAPTLRSVAERAGVSPATVWRALAGDQPVAAGTRDRVLRAANDLGYSVRPTKGDKATESIVVMSPSLGHLALAQVLGGVEPLASEAGLSTIFQHTGHDPRLEIQAFQKLVKGKPVRAVVVIGGVEVSDHWRESVGASIRTLVRRGVRVIFCGRNIPDHGIDEVATVDYDSRGGAAAATSVLLGKGHVKIGWVRGTEGLSTSDERTAGYLEAMASFGVEVDPGLILAGERSAVDAVQRAKRLLVERPDITAVAADSDGQALGVLRAAHELGIPVPGRLSITGFDAHPLTRVAIPALTTVHVPFEELGRRAARGALGTDPDVAPGSSLMLATHVVMRESVAVRP